MPYDIWVKQGYLQTAEGNEVHYGYIERFIERLGERFNIKEIAFDRWGAVQMVQNLENMGFTVVPFGQGFKDMSPPTKELMKLILEHKIAHGGHPVLRWNMDNIFIRTDPAAAWIEEGGALNFGESKFAQILLDAHKLHVAIKVTEELLYDNAFNLENHILTSFGKALANAEEDAFLNGDGTGKPTGIFNKKDGGTYLKKITALKSDDLIDLIHALKRPYRKNAKFIMNDKTIAQVRKLKDNNGAYIWQASYQENEPDRILGYPVFTSAFAPENAIAFGDYSYYNIGDRGTRAFKELNELFAGNGMIRFVAKERVDGKLVLKEAVQILPIKTAAA